MCQSRALHPALMPLHQRRATKGDVATVVATFVAVHASALRPWQRRGTTRGSAIACAIDASCGWVVLSRELMLGLNELIHAEAGHTAR